MSGIGTTIAIGAAGAFGAIARYFVAQTVAAFQSPNGTIGQIPLPIATWIANMLGCFLLGGLTLSGAGESLSPLMRRAIATGFLGALTTYSTYSVETYMLFGAGQTGAAIGNVLLQVIGGLLAVGAGAYTGHAVFGPLG